MANVYKHVMDTNDFFDTVVYCDCDKDDATGWEDFLVSVAETAAEQSGSFSMTKFEDFIDRKGYADQIADVLYEAAKAFTNERIRETGADFDYC